MTGFAFRQNSFALGHALANLAYAEVLSEKLPFSRFSQVPTGSDYPCSEAVLHESKGYRIFYFTSYFLYCIGRARTKQFLPFFP